MAAARECPLRGGMKTEAIPASEQNEWKKAAAEAAAKIVESGMVVGLGSGTTAALFIEALGRRVAQEGLRIVGIATSETTASHAASLKIPLTSFAEHTQIDLTIDGADEVKLGSLELIKGHGGALLREKIVASASKRMAIVADETKIVKRLGTLVPVPVEVVQYGWEATKRKLELIGAHPKLRMSAEGRPFITDGGNYIFHCAYGPMKNPEKIGHDLDHIVGAVEHGLFLGYATQVFIGGPSGVKVWKKGEAARRPNKAKRRKSRGR
jgi:ribose 5-phosphate isomerase A